MAARQDRDWPHQRSPNCRHCGAPIYWYKAPDGTWVPREDNERSERHRCKPNFESLED